MISVQITPYDRRYREAIHSLLFYSRYTHVHLDWYKVAHWLETGNPTVHLAWHQQRLVGMLGAAPPLHGTSWIRLAGVDPRLNAPVIITQMWDALQADLRTQGVHSVYVLLLNNWLKPFLAELGFTFMEEVITLFRKSTIVPQNRIELDIHVAYHDDVIQLTSLDNATFDPPWQLSRNEMYQALRLSALCTVAKFQGRVVGYQLSTRHHTSGHLARLGVLPQAQGNGIGTQLIIDLIRRFVKRGVRSITVNTQLTNVHSQNLYYRHGFHRNGFDLPVWQFHLQPSTNRSSSS